MKKPMEDVILKKGEEPRFEFSGGSCVVFVPYGDRCAQKIPQNDRGVLERFLKTTGISKRFLTT